MEYTLNYLKKTQTSQPDTGWTWKHEELNQLCPKISPYTWSKVFWRSQALSINPNPPHILLGLPFRVDPKNYPTIEPT